MSEASGVRGAFSCICEVAGEMSREGVVMGSAREVILRGLDRYFKGNLNRVWVVRYGNYTPAEVDSVWLTEAGANRRVRELNEKGTMWEVDVWEVGEKEGGAK